MKTILNFLRELQENNTREWFNDHKSIYLETKARFNEFVEEQIMKLEVLDPEFQGVTVKNSVYRIYRDVRFSSDKSPYKTHFGAFMAAGGRKNGMGGYYIHLDATQSFLGGGIYQPEPDKLKKIRKEIFDFPEDIKKILENPGFKNHFRLYEKDKLKRPPKGYSDDFELIETLKLKHFIASYEFSDDSVSNADFSQTVTEQFKALVPLNTFLNRALTSEQG